MEESENELFSRKTMVPFGISMSLMVFQQWTGVNTVIFNTVTIFKAAKISIDAHLASNIVGLIQLIATASMLKLLKIESVSGIEPYLLVWSEAHMRIFLQISNAKI